MADFEKNLWAPWRMEYIESITPAGDGGCFLCRYRDAPGEDRRNLVLRRTPSCMILLNRFPYSNGHLLVAPLSHTAQPEDLPDAVFAELCRTLRDAKRVLQSALSPQGFNIGMNLGKCAGAGLPDHLHWHIVPRWAGDTNFMSVVGDVRVIPESLERVFEKCAAAAASLGV